jgi:hypothetical protein
MKKDGLWNVKTAARSLVPRSSTVMAAVRKCRLTRSHCVRPGARASVCALLFFLKSGANLRKYPPFFASEFQFLPRKLPLLAFYQPR